jgi:predicted permease
VRDDIRYALRRLRRQPGFTAVALLSLALGIGVNTAIFTLVNAVMLRDAPAANSEQLVNIYLDQPGFTYSPLSYPEYRDVEAGTRDVFAGISGALLSLVQRDHGDRLETLPAELVTGNHFELLGLRAAAGRLFTAADDVAPGGHPVAVISHAYWQRAFDGGPAAVGGTLRLNGMNYEIIGVMPERYAGTLRGIAPDVYLPIAMINQVQPSEDDQLEARSNHSLFVTARLRPDRTVAAGEAAVANVAVDLRDRAIDGFTAQHRFIVLASDDVILFPPVDRVIVPAAGVLTGAVGLVLLLACANLASFLLARARDRRKEIAIRLALGAGRGALIRQLLTETVLLALVGGAAGVGVAVVLLRLLSSADIPLPIPITLDLAPDPTVLAFTALISLAAGVLFGLAPALQSTNPDVSPTLRNETTGGPPAKLALRNVLVVGQVAISLVLLMAAGLFVRSFQARQNVDPGFGASPAAILTFAVPADRYDDVTGEQAMQRIGERIAALPGVDGVGRITNLHLNPLSTNTVTLRIDGVEPPPGLRGHGIDHAAIDAGFFDAAGMRVVHGRDFGAEDTREAPDVAIVNEAFVQRFWPGEDAVGKIVRRGDDRAFRIVGVAADAKIRSLGEAPRPFIYWPFAQEYQHFVTMVARTAGGDAALVPRMLTEARAVEPDVVLFATNTMAAHIGAQLLPARLGATVFAGFAALALTLALVGLYGVVRYAVASRTREVGIRMSLGADVGTVVRMLLGAGLRLVLIGAAAGLLLAAAGSRVLSGLLFGVPAIDPVTFSAVPIVFIAVATLAAYLPARRASRIDPVRALKSD